MIPIKSTGRTLTEMQELEAMAAELLKTARKLPPGPVVPTANQIRAY
jgi:hypothetical protein